MRLIDADAIIEVMKKCAENPENKQALLCYRYTQRILEEAPTVEPFAPWHRVEDELPKDNTWCVFISENKHNFEQYRWIGTYSEEWGFQDDDRFMVGNVKYWMPIEPPKEDA